VSFMDYTDLRVLLMSLLTWTLDNNWSTSHPDRFTPTKRLHYPLILRLPNLFLNFSTSYM
jgi:hypothetical protein